MHDIEAVLLRAQDRLNQSLAEYQEGSLELATEFLELKLQAAMFQYEICAEMVSFVRNGPVGFARNVALKGLIHRLYEYDQLLSADLIRRLLALAKARGAEIEGADIKAERKKWRDQLARLKKWSDIRNQATGHYDKDIAKQVQLVQGISQEEVMSVTQAFLLFNMSILTILKNAGSGNGANH
jgi:hypothetical protein